MDYEKIKELIKIMEDSSLTELELEDDDFSISLSKLGNEPVMPMQGMPMMQAMPMMTGAPAATAAPEQAAEESEEDLYITSPIVGVFYSAPAPDAPAYVKVGDHVKKGQTVCILEAMKLMNEIQSDWDCEIEAVLVSNEQKVEYGQPLFRVKKL